MQDLAFDFGVLHPDSLFWKNGCIKLPAFATGNRGFACFGCKELFFLATIFHQNL
jgi:hypothetical protein